MKIDNVNSEEDINKIIDNIRKGNSVVLPEDSNEVTKDGLNLYNGELYYKSSGSKMSCFECGQNIVSGCELGVKEYAYCDNCDIKYTRDREYIIQDKVSYKIDNNYSIRSRSIDRILDYEYECQECGNTHKYTKPDGEWVRPEPYLHSYEGISLNCVCGDIIHLGDKQEKEIYKCKKCGRDHKINLKR